MHRLEVKAELLCFLVLYEIVAFGATGTWLCTDHLVESTRVWLRCHDHQAHWYTRIRLSRLAADLAYQVIETCDLVAPQHGTPRLLTSDMQANFASPRVVVIYARCVKALLPSKRT
jgi:hypothetical protein